MKTKSTFCVWVVTTAMFIFGCASPQLKGLQEYTEVGNYRGAADYYRSQKSYFRSNDDGKEVLREIGSQLNDDYTQKAKLHQKKLEAFANIPDSSLKWPQIDRRLDEARTLTNAYRDEALLVDLKFHNPEVEQLENIISDIAHNLHTKRVERFGELARRHCEKLDKAGRQTADKGSWAAVENELAAARKLEKDIAAYKYSTRYAMKCESADRLALTIKEISNRLAAAKLAHEAAVLAGDLQISRNELADRSNWPTLSTNLQQATAVLKKYEHYERGAGEFENRNMAMLENAVANIKRDLSQLAPNAFSAFGHGGQDSFFKVYPLAFADEKSFFQNHYPQIDLNTICTDEESLAFFHGHYVRLLQPDQERYLTLRFLQLILEEQSIKKFVTAFDFKNLNNQLDSGGFTAIDAGDLLNVKLFEHDCFKCSFTVKVKSEDFATEMFAMQSLKAKLSDQANAFSVYAIPVVSNFNETSSIPRTVVSRYHSGFRQVPNPEYAEAKQTLVAARQAYQNAQAEYQRNLQQMRQQQQQMSQAGTYNAGMAVLQSFSSGISDWSVRNAKSMLNDAEQNLYNTPQYLQEKTYTTYQFTTNKKTYRKQIAAIVIVPKNKLIRGKIKTCYDVYQYKWQDDRSFQFVSGIHPDDPKYHESSYDSPESALEFQNEAVDLPVNLAFLAQKLQKKITNGSLDEVLGLFNLL